MTSSVPRKVEGKFSAAVWKPEDGEEKDRSCCCSTDEILCVNPLPPWR
jgi:hypothetical protein